MYVVSVLPSEVERPTHLIEANKSYKTETHLCLPAMCIHRVREREGMEGKREGWRHKDRGWREREDRGKEKGSRGRKTGDGGTKRE